MRCALIAAFLVAAGPVRATPKTWDGWVGDYRGTLVWRQCTAPGAKVVAVAIDAVDGTMRVDLTSVGAALRIFSLQQDAAGWDAQDSDLSIRIAQRTANKPHSERSYVIDLAITYDGGCTARGQLVRSSTGVPACDALVGWARIEATCSKTTDKLESAIGERGDGGRVEVAEGEGAADIARARRQAITKTKFEHADAARCTQRADTLARALIDAGCAPHPDPQIGTRAVACRSLSDATAKLARCTRVPREIMQRLSTTASALSAAAQTAEQATLPFVEQQCRDARAALAGTSVQFGCQL